MRWNADECLTGRGGKCAVGLSMRCSYTISRSSWGRSRNAKGFLSSSCIFLYRLNVATRRKASGMASAINVGMMGASYTSHAGEKPKADSGVHEVGKPLLMIPGPASSPRPSRASSSMMRGYSDVGSENGKWPVADVGSRDGKQNVRARTGICVYPLVCYVQFPSDSSKSVVCSRVYEAPRWERGGVLVCFG